MNEPDGPSIPPEERLKSALDTAASHAPEVIWPMTPSDSRNHAPRRTGPTGLSIYAAVGIAVFAIFISLVVVLRIGQPPNEVTATSGPPSQVVGGTSSVQPPGSNAVIGGSPRVQATYLPSGFQTSTTIEDSTRPVPPGWIIQWQRKDASRNYELAVAVASSSDARPPIVTQGVSVVDVNGQPGYIDFVTPGSFALTWQTDDGLVTQLSGYDPAIDSSTLQTLARSVTYGPAPDGMAGRIGNLGVNDLPPGYTYRTTGRWSVFDQKSGVINNFSTTDGRNIMVQSIAIGYSNPDLTWLVDEPTQTFAGQDDLQFVSSRPPGDGESAPAVNEIYGGRSDVTIRIRGPVPLSELVKVAQGLKVVSS